MKKGTRNPSGSLILMVLIVMTALILIIHSMGRSSFYLSALALEREKS